MYKVVTITVPVSVAMGDRASHCCNNRKSFTGMQESALSTHSKTLDVELQSSQERPGTAMKTLVGIISKVAALESAAVGAITATHKRKKEKRDA